MGELHWISQERCEMLGLKSKVTSVNPVRVKIMSSGNRQWTSASIHFGMFVQSFQHPAV